ncbi:hypothetical protein RV07_GL000189 [Enterococcus malodoratus]|nr:hypothetical protein RV07_GL000189 [Enterococcus malodoratus]
MKSIAWVFAYVNTFIENDYTYKNSQIQLQKKHNSHKTY